MICYFNKSYFERWEIPVKYSIKIQSYVHYINFYKNNLHRFLAIINLSYFSLFPLKTYLPWAYNDGTSGEYCVEMFQASGQWDDIPCSATRPALCEKYGIKSLISIYEIIDPFGYYISGTYISYILIFLHTSYIFYKPTLGRKYVRK